MHNKQIGQTTKNTSRKRGNRNYGNRNIQMISTDKIKETESYPKIGSMLKKLRNSPGLRESHVTSEEHTV